MSKKQNDPVLYALQYAREMISGEFCSHSKPCSPDMQNCYANFLLKAIAIHEQERAVIDAVRSDPLFSPEVKRRLSTLDAIIAGKK